METTASARGAIGDMKETSSRTPFRDGEIPNDHGSRKTVERLTPSGADPSGNK